jgi:transporter family protein
MSRAARQRGRREKAMSTSSSWVLFALGAAFFAALTSVFGKLGVADINSNLATFIRTVVILVMIAAIVSLRQEWRAPASVPGHSWLFLTLSGAATGLSWLCFYRALQLGPVSKVAPIDKLSVAFAILLGAIFLGEKLAWSTILGGGLIVLGSVVIIAF